MVKLAVSGNADSSLPVDLNSHADIEIVSEAADVLLVDCSSGKSGGIKEALSTGLPVLLYRPDEAVLTTLKGLTGYTSDSRPDLIGIRQVSSPEGPAGYLLLDGNALPVTEGVASSGESEPPVERPMTLADRVVSLAGRLRVTSAPHVLKAGTNNYTPGAGAKYWHVTNSWGPITRTLSQDDDINVRQQLNGSVQAQTPSFMVTADLHIYFTDDDQPSYHIYARYQVTSAAGQRLADTGDARGYFLSKIFMDFQLETSEGQLTPLDHVPQNYDTADGRVFNLSTAQMRLKVKTDKGTGLVTFQPEDSVTFATKGWGIKDQSSGNRVKICFHQKEGWNSWDKERTAFGSWSSDVFSGKYEGKVNDMAEASFSTIVMQAVGAWRLTGSFNGKHEIYMTLRPGDMGFHQEMAFLHNPHSCYAGGNTDHRHHHLFWDDFWAGDAWYLKLSDLPKPTL